MRIFHLYETDDSVIEFTNTSRDYHHGQHDLTLWATVDGKRVGKIDYSVYEDDPQIQMIEVNPSARRMGVGTKLLYELQKGYPDKEIDWGSLTTDGVELRNRINFVKQPSESIDEFNNLHQLQAQAKKYESFVATNWINGGPQTDKVKSAMEQCYDLEHDINAIEYHLYGKSPYIHIMIPKGAS